MTVEPATVVAAFYHFARLPQFRSLQPWLLERCNQLGLRGSILLAEEGINGTVAGSAEGIASLLAALRAMPEFAALEHKESLAEAAPFHRMKVKLKAEIVSMGVPGTDPAHLVGTYVDAAEWNALLRDPEVLVIDTRNDYEVAIGTFAAARDPGTRSFREFPAWAQAQLGGQKQRKVAMFCTGGIRCEKATSYLKAQDFAEVYHLRGGILKYLETVPADDNLWQGECFVFDERVSVDKHLRPGSHQLCRACRRPLLAGDTDSPDYQPGVCCPRCVGERSPTQKRAAAEREKQVALAEGRGAAHLGVPFVPRRKTG